MANVAKLQSDQIDLIDQSVLHSTMIYMIVESDDAICIALRGYGDNGDNGENFTYLMEKSHVEHQ